MYKIPGQIVLPIEKTVETWWVELTAGGKSLAEVKIQRGIFQRGALSLLLLVIAMMPLKQILRKCTAEYKLSKSQEKINHLMYMDDIKLFAKNERELETLIQTVRIYCQDIEMDFGIEKWSMLIMKSRNRRMMDRMEPPNQEKFATFRLICPPAFFRCFLSNSGAYLKLRPLFTSQRSLALIPLTITRYKC